jgi:hypothetical protein
MVKNTLSKLIEKYQEGIEDDARDYIGASSIGSDCLRQIWYQFKGIKAQGVPAKTRRTWAIGKKLEGLVVEWLDNADIGIVVIKKTFTATNMPYFQGHLDAVVTFGKASAILEIKTAKDASFKIFVNKGLRIWYPQYYAQVQSYMGMSGIHEAFVLVLNKDTSEIADEHVLFDLIFYEKLKEKAEFVYKAVVEPPRINGSPLWFQCKMCKYNKVCHG